MNAATGISVPRRVTRESGLPPAPRGLVTRRRLLGRLDRATNGPLALVTGGMGFGKTSLLTSWAADARRPVAWVALEPEHADAAVFAAAVAAAAGRVAEGSCAATGSLLAGLEEASPEALGRSLAADLARLPRGTALVLDDAHHLAGGSAAAALDALLGRLPPGLHVVLAGREELPLAAVGRLELQGQVVRIGERSLRLTPPEAERLLGARAARADPETLAAALAVLDGWPAGVRLLQLRLRDPDTPLDADPRSAVAAIGERLLAQVLDREPPETVALLERLCVLPRVAADLADAMQDGDGPPAADVLAGLARRHLFVDAEDARGRAHRLHAILREALAARVVARSGPEGLAALHRRAAEWFAAHGQVDAAIGHLLDAGDLPAAVALIGERGVQALSRDDWRAVRLWLRRVPAEAVVRHPELLALRAHLQRSEGDRPGAAASVAAAQRLLAVEPPGPRRDWLEAELDAVRCVTAAFEGGLAPILPVAARLMAAGHASPMARSFGILAWALAMQETGRGAEAVETVERELAAAGSDDCCRAYALLARVALALAAPDPGLLPALANAAAEAGRTGSASRPHVWGLVMLAVVLRELGDLDEAAEAAAAALEVGRGEYLGADLEAVHVLAVSLALLGDRAGAMAAVEDLRRRAGASGSGYTRDFVALVDARARHVLGERPDPAWLASALPATALVPLRFAPQAAAVAAALLLAHAPDRAAEALAAVEASLAAARERHAGWHVARLLPLLALARETAGDRPGALAALREAFAIDPGVMQRRFLDHGEPMRRLLGAAIALPATGPDGARDPLPALAGAMLGRFPREAAAPAPDPKRLTPREREVLAGIARFLTNAEIAAELGIAEETVKQHASSVFRKLGAANRREAARLAASALAE